MHFAMRNLTVPKRRSGSDSAIPVRRSRRFANSGSQWIPGDAANLYDFSKGAPRSTRAGRGLFFPSRIRPRPYYCTFFGAPGTNLRGCSCGARDRWIAEQFARPSASGSLCGSNLRPRHLGCDLLAHSNSPFIAACGGKIEPHMRGHKIEGARASGRVHHAELEQAFAACICG
jgi:hypothetical protein